MSWHDARKYVAWLSALTGKTYRLLTEAEYEYATRAGTTTAYPWGDEAGENNASCGGCGRTGQFEPVPVGSFAPNKFGLYDMVGNVWEWVEDCVHTNYVGAPADGSAWLEADHGDCSKRIARGGSNDDVADSAVRRGVAADWRSRLFGFRIARTLIGP